MNGSEPSGTVPGGMTRKGSEVRVLYGPRRLTCEDGAFHLGAGDERGTSSLGFTEVTRHHGCFTSDGLDELACALESLFRTDADPDLRPSAARRTARPVPLPPWLAPVTSATMPSHLRAICPPWFVFLSMPRTRPPDGHLSSGRGGPGTSGRGEK